MVKKLLIIFILSICLFGCKKDEDASVVAQKQITNDECYLQMHTREGDTVYGDLYYRELVSYSELKDLSDGYIVTTNGTKLRIMNLLETISFLDPSNQLTTDQYKEMVSDYSSMFEYSFYNEVTKNLYVLSNAKEGYYALINFETGFELMFLID